MHNERARFLTSSERGTLLETLRRGLKDYSVTLHRFRAVRILSLAVFSLRREVRSWPPAFVRKAASTPRASDNHAT
jgi:hypothetical protein